MAFSTREGRKHTEESRVSLFGSYRHSSKHCSMRGFAKREQYRFRLEDLCCAARAVVPTVKASRITHLANHDPTFLTKL